LKRDRVPKKRLMSKISSERVSNEKGLRKRGKERLLQDILGSTLRKEPRRKDPASGNAGESLQRSPRPI